MPPRHVVCSCGSSPPKLEVHRCNAPKPLWSSRLPIPIRSPPSICETFERKSFITHHLLYVTAGKFRILKRFKWQNEVIGLLFTVTIFLSLRQSQKLGVQLHPCSKVEPPLACRLGLLESDKPLNSSNKTTVLLTNGDICVTELQ